MNVTVWLLTSPSPSPEPPLLFGSLTQAAAVLRDRFDPAGELTEVPDEDLTEVLAATGSPEVTLTSHTVQVPTYTLPTQCPVPVDAVEEALAENSDVPDATVIRVEELGYPVWYEALEAAFAPHQRTWEGIVAGTVRDTTAILLDMAAAGEADTDGPE